MMIKEDLIIKLLVANLNGIKLILQAHPDRISAAMYRKYADTIIELAEDKKDD